MWGYIPRFMISWESYGVMPHILFHISLVIVLFLGIVVVGILISMYLPMFDLVNVIGGG